ncbi:MAG: hypothetical protein Tsb005_16910 [Gammaproteobacteria bacterium]
MHIQFITHACLKITSDFGTLICDPWLLNEPVFNLSTWKFPPALLTPEEVIKNCDYLLITHSHEDHFHIPSLNYFPRDIPIILSAFDTHPSLRAHTIELVLRQLGFNNITRLRSWESFSLSAKSTLTCIPNAKSRDHDWENMGFVLRDADTTLLNLNDNVNDEALCHEIKQRFPHIDIGFIQTGGVTMFPGCFRMPLQDMQRAADERKFRFLEQRRLLDFIQPRVVAPFAGDFAWFADQYFHNNWANRTTPLLFQQMLTEYYASQDVELILLQPSDTWSLAEGHQYQTRRIDWHNMLDEIKYAKTLFTPKLHALEHYLHEVNLNNLMQRSQRYTHNIANYITRDYIDFSARFRFTIEGAHSNFSFVTKTDPINKFQVDWNDHAKVDQTLYVPEHIWAAILEGKLMWNIIQWVGQAEQEQFTRDMGRMWFWMEYHIDLNNKNIQVNIADQLLAQIGRYTEPTKATFPMHNETQQLAKFYGLKIDRTYAK